jgi:hypothetical protein
VVNTLAASLAQHRQFGFAESAVEIGGSEIFFNRSRLGSVSSARSDPPVDPRLVDVVGLLLHTITLWKTARGLKDD